MGNTMLCIRKEPNKAPEIVQVENTLEALQKEVGGYIETVTIASDAAIICDEEGRLKGKSDNCSILGVDFVGTILVVGVSGEEFASIPAAKIKSWMRVLFGEGTK